MESDTFDETENKLNIETDNESYCQACGNILTNYSILICLDCLDDECSSFFETSSKLAEIPDEDLKDSIINVDLTRRLGNVE